MMLIRDGRREYFDLPSPKSKFCVGGSGTDIPRSPEGAQCPHQNFLLARAPSPKIAEGAQSQGKISNLHDL